MYKSLQIADGIRNSAFPRSYFQTVQGGEGHVEVCPKLVIAPCLTLLERCEALCVAEFKFHQEPASVYLHDVHPCQREVVGEEYLVLAAILGDPNDDLDSLFERLAVDYTGIAFSTVETIVNLMEHPHVEILYIDLPVILLGSARFSCLRSIVEVVQGCVIPETAYQLQSELCQPVHKVLLRKEGICYDSFGVLIDSRGHASKNMQVPVDEREALFLILRILLLNLSLHLALMIWTLYRRPCHGLDMLYIGHSLAACQIPHVSSLLVYGI